jgi:hypothetical protein
MGTESYRGGATIVVHKFSPKSNQRTRKLESA